MGTLVYRSTKSEAVRRELADLQGHSTLLASRLIGPRLWFLAERAGIRWIGLTLIHSRGHEVAVKHMDETVGPYYYDCPLTYLDQASAPHGEHAGPWREKVRAYHAEQAARRARRAQARPGQRVQLGRHVYVLQQAFSRYGWGVTRELDGQSMLMPARRLSQVEWLPDTPPQPAPPLVPPPSVPPPPPSLAGAPSPASSPT